jgi:hypothetical protein
MPVVPLVSATFALYVLASGLEKAKLFGKSTELNVNKPDGMLHLSMTPIMIRLLIGLQQQAEHLLLVPALPVNDGLRKPEVLVQQYFRTGPLVGVNRCR